jgi:hypothetical protein
MCILFRCFGFGVPVILGLEPPVLADADGSSAETPRAS